MPKKGDDLGTVTATQVILHHANADVTVPDLSVIRGILDNAYIETAETAGTTPRLLVKSSDVAAHNVTRNTALSVNGTNYTVGWPPQSDGTGLTELWLHLV